MSTNKNFTEYKINIDYRYSVDGKDFKGTQFYPLIPNVFSDKKYANELMDKYQNGSEISVYYNPKKPGNSCLITSKDVSPLKYVIMIAIFLVIAVILIFGIKYFNVLFDE